MRQPCTPGCTMAVHPGVYEVSSLSYYNRAGVFYLSPSVLISK